MNAKILRTQKGFTLIELMIVVGIIGILVAIAAPNFSRYQSKARQSEAKIALAAIYSAEKSFFSEYSAYVGSLDSIGYAPEGNKRYYAVGFTGTGGTTSVQGFGGTVTATPMYNRVNAPATWTNACNNTMLTAHTTTPAADPSSFVAGAVGQIREGQACDVWQINENKQLVNTAVVL